MAHQNAGARAIENELGRCDIGLKGGLRNLSNIDRVTVTFEYIHDRLPSGAVGERTVD